MDNEERIAAAIKEVTGLQKHLRKSKQRQVRTVDEKDHMRVVALPWFKQNRGALGEGLPSEAFAAIDARYGDLLERAEKNPARNSVLKILSELRGLLVSNRAVVLTAPETSQAPTPPDFTPLVPDIRMQEILTRRWTETERCLAADANLAATVMMGGLLEGLLLARVLHFNDMSVIFKTRVAPRDRKGKTIQIRDWTLRHYIDVAHELGWIGTAARHVGEVLRDYRNYIHPQKEMSHGVHLESADAKMFWRIVQGLTSEILASVPPGIRRASSS